MGQDVQRIKMILQKYKIIAVVGLSPDPDRPSHQVAQYMKGQGYTIIPVRPPGGEFILGEKSYPSLAGVAGTIEVVDIFRDPKFVPEIVDQAIQKKVKVIWMQDGVIHEEAAAKAKAAGIEVIMDRCMMRDHISLCL